MKHTYMALNLILNSLSDSFKGFIDYYLTNNVEIQVRLLADELETYEKLYRLGEDGNTKVAKVLSRKTKRVWKIGKTSEPRNLKRKKANKNNEKYHNYGIKGH